MDDAFQNLTFEKNLNVLISSFNKPFFFDDRFPMGMLRESKNNAKRADILVYSNCSKNISEQKLKRFKIKSEYYLKPKTPILYSGAQEILVLIGIMNTDQVITFTVIVR